MAPSSPDQSKKARPQSMLAMQFSSALDEMFKLNGIGALELSVEEKKDDLTHQKLQLDDLEARLRETTERLKNMEARHKQQQQQSTTPNSRPAVRPVAEEHDNEHTDDSGGSGSDGSENGERRA